jgi:hypothetical protein
MRRKASASLPGGVRCYSDDDRTQAALKGIIDKRLHLFAALAATGARSGPTDSKDALRVLLNEPFGYALLALIAAGLLCFAAYRAGLYACVLRKLNGCDLLAVGRKQRSSYEPE